jgi:hypothetical protein
MNSKTRIVSATLGIAAAVAIVLGAAPAQARFFAGFGFGYPFYRPFPVFYRPYLPPPPLPVYVVPQPAYYAPPPVAYSETETYYTRRPVHRHRRTVSHRVRTCK